MRPSNSLVWRAVFSSTFIPQMGSLATVLLLTAPGAAAPIKDKPAGNTSLGARRLNYYTIIVESFQVESPATEVEVRESSILILTLALTLLMALLPGVALGRSQIPGPASAQDFDQTFLHQMIMHHVMAVVMAQPVAVGALHGELASLAGDVITTQSAEITSMQSWSSAWYGASSSMPGMEMMPGMQMPAVQPGMEHMPGMQPGSGMMPGMEMMSGMMDMMGLNRLSGGRLEIAFMLMMIPHHEVAITMAQEALARSTHEEVRQLAREIITSQSREIDQMNRWLADWYGL